MPKPWLNRGFFVLAGIGLKSLLFQADQFSLDVRRLKK